MCEEEGKRRKAELGAQMLARSVELGLPRMFRSRFEVKEEPEEVRPASRCPSPFRMAVMRCTSGLGPRRCVWLFDEVHPHHRAGVAAVPQAEGCGG